MAQYQVSEDRSKKTLASSEESEIIKMVIGCVAHCCQVIETSSYDSISECKQGKEFLLNKI